MSEFDEFDFKYEGDYLSQMKGVSENEYMITENFVFTGGKLIQHKWSIDELDNITLDFTYGQQLNNLNLDLFGIILEDYLDIEDLFLHGITGKRSMYLPEKINVNVVDDEGGYKYLESFKYEVKDNYITKITIIDNEDGGRYECEYEIFYED